MGAIICKVAAVAPGNDLKGACVHACVWLCAARTGVFILRYHIRPSPVSGGEKVRRVDEEIRGDYCAV